MPALGLARGKTVYMLFIYLIRVTDGTVDTGRQDRSQATLIERGRSFLKMIKGRGGGFQVGEGAQPTLCFAFSLSTSVVAWVESGKH